MNTFRSPAPGGSLFNMNSKNNIVSNVGNVVSNMGNVVSNVATNAANVVTNAANTATNTVVSAMNTITNTNTGKKFGGVTTYLLIGLFFLIVALFAVFWRQISNGFAVLYDKIRQAFGAAPAPTPASEATEDVTQKPEAPQDDTVHEKRMVEKILPGRQQVFNISKNDYTYYDAEPLCKALGAELATYEQVKKAYADGADWCNYGWVKGQMAVYPTQTNTWEELQQGPEDQRDACGRPGLNGGFFDNPELKFGVNCYGVKPEQKDHDATAIAQGDAAPLSPGGLEFEKKKSKYRGEANTIGILPFNKSAWSS
jgi:hypothetical protein